MSKPRNLIVSNGPPGFSLKKAQKSDLLGTWISACFRLLNMLGVGAKVRHKT